MTDFFEALQGFDPLNIAFGLNFLSLFMKDILKLRFVALGSQATFWAVGASRGNWTIVVWQSLFLVINLVRTAMVLWERREIRFPPDVERLFKSHFPIFNRQEFQAFWLAGEDRTYAPAETVVRQGDRPGALWFVARGEADVLRDGRKVASIGEGHFIGEMSLLTDEPASADVVAQEGGLTTHVWTVAALQKIRSSKHMVWLKIQSRLGRDLVTKIWAKHELEREGAL